MQDLFHHFCCSLVKGYNSFCLLFLLCVQYTQTHTHKHTHEHTYVCIAVFIPVTFPDERDLCVLICSGDIKWYNECVSCYLYLAPVSLYTILHDGKYFITDFCTDWNIITVMWINTMWFIHFILCICFNALYKWHILSNKEHSKEGSKFYRNVFTVFILQ